MKEKKPGIAIEKFSEYVECLHQEADKGFEDQYTVCVVSKCVYTIALSLSPQAIPTSPQFPYTVSDIPHNKLKNRFGNIFPCKFLSLASD